MSARHVMILASAGAGKTYALTSRFVALLAAGSPPERIVALTFTRKAAGEFFDEILHKLARAASDERFAERLGRELEQPRLRAADFRRMLRAMIEAMPRLRLGTLDGFFARIARAFPFELGLTGEFEVLQEHASRVERARVLQRMFARAPEGLDAAQKEFIEAFKRATFGAEEKRLAARLDGFLDEHQETFLAAPTAALWGDAARVWPEGCEWLERGGPTLTEAVATLRARLARRALPETQQARWEAFFLALSEWTPGSVLPKPIEYLLKNALAVWDDIRRGGAEVVVERKRMPLDPEECHALAAVIRHLVSAEVMRRLETTRGIYAVLRGYEAVYHDRVRRSGRLTFSDVQRLLLPGASGVTLGQEPANDGTARLLIDFRLDAQFDHWLLDEFQDTSFGQWSVLRNLIDEVVQDPTGTRSFFCVGDVKQAIYTWREGDHRLFREIFEHYNRAAPGTIVEQHLVRSWRSGPAVIATVNAVFGRKDVLAGLFPGPASTAWNREWRDHESAQPHLMGQVAWLHGADEAERFALTVRLLHELDPIARGLECAILTQTNAMATALADYLRRQGGIPALAESDLRIATDNPLGAALLALLQAAAHPGDTFAQEHVRMTPLAGLLEAEGIRTPETLTLRLLGMLHAGGFERTVEFWLRRLENQLAPADAFSRERGRQFLAAASLFDATGSRNVAEFVAFMERHTVRGIEMSGVVRVMTIHKSKGLGFDVVILPDLEGQRIDQRRDGLAVQRSSEREVQWVLDLPPKLFYEHDATLRTHVSAAEAEAGYEALALLYVAMTRAKRAMYMVTKRVGRSESRNYPKLLTATLAGERERVRVGALELDGSWAEGDPNWARQEVPAAAAHAVVVIDESPLDITQVRPVVRRPARLPSAKRSGMIHAAQVFALDGGDAAGFGEAVHALLAEVEWGDNAPTNAWAGRNLLASVLDEVMACLRAPALAGLWARQRGAEVWRERGFEIVLDGDWVTGVFDRVVVERDAGGRVQWVTVFDFKTDRLAAEASPEEAARRHAVQLNLYRQVAARLAGVPVHVVTCEIVFTALRCRVRVAA